MTFEKEYSVSFTFVASKFSPGWHNILHFTTGDDVHSPGSRIPGVWMYKDALYICSDVNGISNYCWTSKPIPVNVIFRLQIRQIREGAGYIYLIQIDGYVHHEVINRQPRVFHGVKLYASDPWYAAQKGEMRNLEYSKG